MKNISTRYIDDMYSGYLEKVKSLQDKGVAMQAPLDRDTYSMMLVGLKSGGFAKSPEQYTNQKKNPNRWIADKTRMHSVKQINMFTGVYISTMNDKEGRKQLYGILEKDPLLKSKLMSTRSAAELKALMRHDAAFTNGLISAMNKVRYGAGDMTLPDGTSEYSNGVGAMQYWSEINSPE